MAGWLAWLVWSRLSLQEKLPAALIMLGSALLARLVFVYLIRLAYQRRRPFHDRPIKNLLKNGWFYNDNEWSFPSGHASFFFALGTAAMSFNVWLSAGLLGAASLISVSRVLAGVHYWSDVLAGAGLGLMVGWVVTWLT
jgi:undecaprenyl-diphosphatase